MLGSGSAHDTSTDNSVLDGAYDSSVHIQEPLDGVIDKGTLVDRGRIE